MGANWGLVEEISAPVFDTMIRQAGWHFMWMKGASSRKGFASKEEEATHHALIHALDGVGKRFNGAELESVKVKKHFGLYFSTVTLQPRQIQQQTPWMLLTEAPCGHSQQFRLPVALPGN